jgi:alpha/beta hydrolase fold
LARGCSSRLASTEESVQEIGRYMTTPSVVEDMVAIVEALGKWREEESRKLLSEQSISQEQKLATMKRTKWVKGKEKLNYWGFSYGTLLGMTFATMHPNRVGRLAVDGVMEADDYYNGKSLLSIRLLRMLTLVATWVTNLVDADSILESFFNECFKAGQQKCAFYSENGVDEMRKTYFDILKRLQEDPISVRETGQYGPSLVTVTEAMALVTAVLYSPRVGFPVLAQLLNELPNGDITILLQVRHGLLSMNTCPSSNCVGEEWSSSCYNHDLVCKQLQMNSQKSY